MTQEGGVMDVRWRVTHSYILEHECPGLGGSGVASTHVSNTPEYVRWPTRYCPGCGEAFPDPASIPMEATDE